MCFTPLEINVDTHVSDPSNVRPMTSLLESNMDTHASSPDELCPMFSNLTTNAQSMDNLARLPPELRLNILERLNLEDMPAVCAVSPAFRGTHDTYQHTVDSAHSRETSPGGYYRMPWPSYISPIRPGRHTLPQ